MFQVELFIVLSGRRIFLTGNRFLFQKFRGRLGKNLLIRLMILATVRSGWVILRSRLTKVRRQCVIRFKFRTWGLKVRRRGRELSGRLGDRVGTICCDYDVLKNRVISDFSRFFCC